MTGKYEPEGWEAMLFAMCSLGGLALRAVVASVAWGWFIVPLGIRPVGFWWMVVALWVLGGLLLVESKTMTTQQEYENAMAVRVGAPLLVFAFLAVVRALTV